MLAQQHRQGAQQVRTCPFSRFFSFDIPLSDGLWQLVIPSPTQRGMLVTPTRAATQRPESCGTQTARRSTMSPGDLVETRDTSTPDMTASKEKFFLTGHLVVTGRHAEKIGLN